MLALHVATYNAEACALYHRHGFRLLRRHLQFYTFNAARAPLDTQTTYDAYLFAMPLVDMPHASAAAAGALWPPALQGALAAANDVAGWWRSLVQSCAGPRRDCAQDFIAEVERGEPQSALATASALPATADPHGAPTATSSQSLDGTQRAAQPRSPPGRSASAVTGAPTLTSPAQHGAHGLTAAERDLALYRRLFRRAQR